VGRQLADQQNAHPTCFRHAATYSRATVAAAGTSGRPALGQRGGDWQQRGYAADVSCVPICGALVFSVDAAPCHVLLLCYQWASAWFFPPIPAAVGDIPAA